MNGIFGTDVVAVACILGGAAVGGAVTLAGGGGEHAHAGCAEAVAESAPVVVALGADEPSIVVAPRVRAHRHAHCVRVEGFEPAALDYDFDFDFDFDFDGLGEELEAELAGLGDELESEIAERLEEEMARLEEELSRLEEIGR